MVYIKNSIKINKMKKILYLALLAVGLQSCLKDKAHETEVFDGVGSSKDVLIFSTIAKPATNFQITAVNINSVAEPILPSIGIVLKPGAQTFSIPVELPIRKLATDVDVTVTYDTGKIDTYNAARVVEYNDLKAKYDDLKMKYDAAVAANSTIPAPVPLLAVPPIPVAPKLYNPFIPIPTGKYTLSKTVTVKAGEQVANISFSMPTPDVDLSPLNKYMLPITLTTTSGVLISNPTTLIKVEPSSFNPYIGTFRYVGQFSREAVAGDGYSINAPQPGTDLEIVRNAATGAIEMPVAGVGVGVGNGFRMVVAFTPTTISIIEPAGNLVGVTGLGQLPSSNPRLTYNADGLLMKIENFHYTYLNTATPPAGRRFFMSSITRVQ